MSQSNVTRRALPTSPAPAADSSLKGIGAVLAACMLLAMAHPAAAQSGCGALADPNSIVGKKCPAAVWQSGVPSNPLPPSATPPYIPDRSMQPTHPRYTTPAAAGQQPGRGQFVCAVVEPSTGRCLTMRPNTKDYDDAVQTGVEAAMMGMQVQADAMRRAQEMGLTGPAIAPQGVPQMGHPQMQPQAPTAGYSGTPSLIGGGQAAPGGTTGFADCVGAMSARLKSATGKNPTPAQTEQILLQCQ